MKTVSMMKLASAAIALALLAGCAANPASGLPQLESQRVADYRLAAGDNVRIVVFGQENVPTEFIVDDHGMISVPLAGAVEAEGLTTAELEKKVAAGLKGVLVDPSVSAQVITPRPVYVLGAVNKPGSYPYVRNMTVLNAVAMGGGFMPEAYDDHVRVTREVNGAKREFRADQNTYVQPEDVVYVYSMY